MKKILVFAMILCVLALAMTGCSKKEEPAATEAPTVAATEEPVAEATEEPAAEATEEPAALFGSGQAGKAFPCLRSSVPPSARVPRRRLFWRETFRKTHSWPHPRPQRSAPRSDYGLY